MNRNAARKIEKQISHFKALFVLTLVAIAYGCELAPTPEGNPSLLWAASLRTVRSAGYSHEARPGPPGPPVFREIAHTAGLNYRWVIRGKRPLNILQTIGNGCAFLDYNADGNLDILLVGPSLAMFEGDGRGHFTDVTRAVGLDKLHGGFLGCAVGDYDNDGFDDVYISGYRAAVLLHNDAGKHFSDVTGQAGLKPQPWGTSCGFADLDGDGYLDLYVANYVQFDPRTDLTLCTFKGILTGCGPIGYGRELARSSPSTAARVTARAYSGVCSSPGTTEVSRVRMTLAPDSRLMKSR